MSVSMDICLKRPSKVYHPGETLYGSVVVNSKGECKHEGLQMQLDGLLSIITSSNKAGLIDTLVNSPKPSVLHNEVVDVCKGGRLPNGTSEITFEVTLPLVAPNKPMFETFHGNNINVQYSLRCTMKRSLLAKPLVQMVEFIVEHKNSAAPPSGSPLQFSLTPSTVSSAAVRTRLPRFHVSASLDTDGWILPEPLTGEVCVTECSGGTIASIEVQLHRVETCGNPADDMVSKEASEVQGWQVVDGDVPRGLAVPFCLPLPRAFTCITTVAHNFAVEFRVSVVVAFTNDHIVSQSLPIVLRR